MKTLNTRRNIGRIIKLIFLGSILVGLIGTIGVVVMSIQGAPDIETFQFLAEQNVPTKVYDSEGNQIDQFNGGEWSVYVSLDEISKDLQQAIIVLEDERFYEHNGVDFRKIGGAIFNNLRNGSLSSGGTTITQQVVKNNISLSRASGVMSKLQEQYLALQLEKRYSKDQIFEWYLNQTGFGQGTAGVQAAANRYFGKDVSELSLVEAVVLAVIPEYPTRYNPIINPENNWEKVQVCLDKLVAAGYITEEEKEEALEDKPYERINETQVAYAEREIHQYYVEAAIKAVKEDLKNQCGYTDLEASSAIYGGGLQIYTNLDSNLQGVVDKYIGEESEYFKEAYEIVLEYSIDAINSEGKRIEEKAFTTVKSQDDIEAWQISQKAAWGITEEADIITENLIQIPQPQVAFVLMDYKNGEVKALAGGRDKTVNQGLNYATQALRMPGSTFNILAAYAPALDMGCIDENTVLEDVPFEITLEDGHIYKPRNLDGKYKGKISLEEAIYERRNAVASKVLVEEVGVEEAFSYLEKFGFTSLEDTDKTVALAQGGLVKGVTALELNGAYSAIANDGTYIKPTLYREVRDAKGEIILKSEPEKTTIIKKGVAQLLTKMMESTVEKGEGTCIKENFNTVKVAGELEKRNGTKDMIFVGYTPYYSATIWTGYSEPKKINEEVTNYGMDTWAKIMNEIHEELE